MSFSYSVVMNIAEVHDRIVQLLQENPACEIEADDYGEGDLTFYIEWYVHKKLLLGLDFMGEEGEINYEWVSDDLGLDCLPSSSEDLNTVMEILKLLGRLRFWYEPVCANNTVVSASIVCEFQSFKEVMGFAQSKSWRGRYAVWRGYPLETIRIEIPSSDYNGLRKGLGKKLRR